MKKTKNKKNKDSQRKKRIILLAAIFVIFGATMIFVFSRKYSEFPEIKVDLKQSEAASGYTDNGNGTVTDNNTKLIWQKSEDSTARNWATAVTYCDNLTLGGSSEWRLPRVDELSTIVDYARYPAIDPAFAQLQGMDFWSNSPLKIDQAGSRVWLVGFYDGAVFSYSKTSSFYTRCVSGGPFWSFDPLDRLKVSSSNTVTDSFHNRMWQRKNDDTLRTWQNAKSYCSDLSLDGYTDWRLPTAPELQTIIDYTTYSPALSTEVFNVGIMPSSFWSATENVRYAAGTYAVQVDPQQGDISAINNSSARNVLCVRESNGTVPANTCTSFTYSAWGACQSNNTQARTVTASTPSGCTGGNPILTQNCTYSNTCTSFTYSAWGACQSNNTQTRTVTASTPSGCTGGNPILTQNCTYSNTCTSFTYSAWGACQSNNTQTRTVTASTPSGCTGGNPVLTQSCSVSTDKTSAYVTRFYQILQGRTPGSGEVDYWKNEFNRVVALGISNGDASLSLAKTFIGSSEYQNKNKSDSQYADDLYKLILGRTGSVGEISYWAGQTRDVGREWTLYQFAYSPEAQSYITKTLGSNSSTPEKSLVNDLYRGILGRFPDSAGYNGWVGYIRSQCGTAQKVKDASSLIAQGFVQSQEYLMRKRTNAQYVEDMYESFLRRGAELGGKNYWTNALNTNSVTRLDMMKQFVGSPEFQGRVQNIINSGCK